MPRLATPEQAKRIRHFYYWTNLSSEFFVWLLWPLPLWWGLRFVLGILLTPEFAFQHLNEPFYGAVLAGFIAWRLRLRQQRAAHALQAYQVGQQVVIYLVSMTENWGAKINGRPRHIITLRKGNELLTIKTFDSTVIEAFSPTAQVAYVLAKYPDIVLPASIVEAPDDDQPPLPTRDISF